MLDEFYLCGLTYSALEMHKSTMKIYDHMSSRDIKKASGKLFCHERVFFHSMMPHPLNVSW